MSDTVIQALEQVRELERLKGRKSKRLKGKLSKLANKLRIAAMRKKKKKKKKKRKSR